ncbi:NADPH-dependent F420 reductase [Streptomyces massasporeus]|uniref:NADPH-dependent F420 reductase n=1 Tax=Streptomyces massasporeus TaxID=67324 RepID=UPI001671FA74|nr:NAD(P)-binding domain-containing protein [Streptomyces massasporeus]GGV57541.1 hypothetical protein GCM10010228_02330 [Streptomyces massasporeus]
MQITIVGAGNMARGIATRALVGGHTVTVTTRDPGKAVRLVDELRVQATGAGRIAAADASAVDTADIVVLAVPFDAAKELATAYGVRLSGKVLIDISNPVDAPLDALVVAPGTSAAEEIAEAVAPGTHVVKAFNTTFATTLVAGQVSGAPLDVFIAGDDEAARATVGPAPSRSSPPERPAATPFTHLLARNPHGPAVNRHRSPTRRTTPCTCAPP